MLSRPSVADREQIENSIDEAVRAMPLLAAGQWTEAVQQLHSATKPMEAKQDGI